MKTLALQYRELINTAYELINNRIEEKKKSELIWLQTNEEIEREQNTLEFDLGNGWETFVPISINTEDKSVTLIPSEGDEIEDDERTPWDERETEVYSWDDIHGLNMLIIADLLQYK